MFYSFLSLNLLFVIVRSYETCDLKLTDLDRNEVNIENYCKTKPCVVKCCAKNEVIHIYNKTRTCKNIEDLKNLLHNNLTKINFDYSDLDIFKNDIYKSSDGEVSTKKFKDFNVLHSDIYMGNESCSIWIKKIKILEKGTLVIPSPNHYEYWMPRETPLFCVDMAIGTKNSTPTFTFFYKVKINDVKSLDIKNYFIAICMLISSFFLILVLVVYSILHQLRNIQGMLLYAYVATLLIMYLLKATSILISMKGIADCVLISQFIYFFILASFFWLKLMSFDIWWTFRGTRKLRDIHRRGINVKMMIYASYAFGVPAAMTIFAAIMDKQDLPPLVVKPMFEKCFISDTFFVYLYVPLMILTGCNCLLFVMTMYNIWLIRRNMASFDKTAVKKNNNNQNRFMLYIKLSSLMGVSWILEIVQMRLPDESVPLWLFIMLNAYNVLIGVVIFFLFVFKTNIFLMLCKRYKSENDTQTGRFKIEKWADRHFKVTSSTRTDISKSSKSYSRTYSRTRSTSDSDGDDTAVKKIELGNGKEILEVTGTDV